MSSATSVSSDRTTLREPQLSALSRIFYSPLWMVGVGLLVRLVCIAVELLSGVYKVPWNLFETVNIGLSLAQGHGFASPFGGSTGPTAWTAPMYPWLISLAFRIFGMGSIGAAFALFSLNSIFSALTSWIIYRIARRTFNLKVAAWSGWIWTFFPFAVYWSVLWIWDTTLSAFLLSLLFMLTLELDGDSRLWRWICYGMLWGVAALGNTSVVAWLPFSGCWLAYRLYRARKPFIVPVVVSALVFWAVITPWLIRDHAVFNKWMFIRGDLGSELRIGNNPDAKGKWTVSYTCNNEHLFAEYKTLGEAAYDSLQAQRARQWIAENPARFLSLSCRKFFYFWYGVPESPLPRLENVLFAALALLSLGGLLLAARRRVHGLFLFATLLIFYPMVYYITFPMTRYRHPIEPVMLILAVWAVIAEPSSRTSRAVEARSE